MKLAHLAVLFALSAACSNTRTLSESRTASAMAPARSSSMSVDEAQSVLDQAKTKLFPDAAADPLANPKSLDDVLAILRADQIDLFPSAAAFAKKDASRKARVLGAQIEIAWGENLRIVAHTIDLLSPDLRQEVRDLEEKQAVGKLPADGQKRLESLKILIEDETRIVQAASRLAPVHLNKGSEMAQTLVQEKPEGYEGYRVLADYYRIRGEWDRYDAMVKEVEKLHPDSTGLRFLKGIALAEREGDADGAAKLLAEAVAKEPKFCRAQAQLVFLASGLTKKYEEYQKLKAMNARHQLVALAGPVIENVYATRERRRTQAGRLDWRSRPE